MARNIKRNADISRDRTEYLNSHKWLLDIIHRFALKFFLKPRSSPSCENQMRWFQAL